MAVILNLIGLNATRPINCKVGAVLRLSRYSPDLMGYDPKVWVTFNVVSKASDTLQCPMR